MNTDIATIICSKCEKSTRIAFDSIEVDVEVEIKKDFSCKKLFLIIYSCPRCGNKMIVQLDDEYSKNLLKDIKKVLAEVAAIRGKGGKVSENKRKKYESLTRELRMYRKALIVDYDGSLYIKDGEVKKLSVFELEEL